MEIQGDGDFKEIEKMVSNGILFDFKREERLLDDLRLAFVGHCLGLGDETLKYHALRGSTQSLLRYTKTVEERINELTSNGDLPQFMKDRYLSGTQAS